MTMTLVQTIEVGSGGAASIEFTGIPQDADDLLLVFSGRTTNASNFDALLMQTSVTSNVYTDLFMYGNGSSVGTQANVGNPNSNLNLAIPGNNLTTNTYGSFSAYFPNYASTTTYKNFSIDQVSENNATLAVQGIYAGVIASNTAITQLKLYIGSGNLAQYSTASLYKITKA